MYLSLYSIHVNTQLPLRVIRFPLIWGHRQTGQINPTDWMSRLYQVDTCWSTRTVYIYSSISINIYTFGYVHCYNILWTRHLTRFSMSQQSLYIRDAFYSMHNLELLRYLFILSWSSKDIVNIPKQKPCLTHTNTHTYAYIYTNTHICIYVHEHIRMHKYIHEYTHIYAYIYIYEHTHMHIYIRTHTYMHIHALTYTHICIYTWTHTHMHIYLRTYTDLFGKIYDADSRLPPNAHTYLRLSSRPNCALPPTTTRCIYYLCPLFLRFFLFIVWHIHRIYK